MVLIPWWLAGVQVSQPTFARSILAVGTQLCGKDTVIFQISCQQCSERLPVIRIILNFENALWQRKRRWKKSRQIILSREVPSCFFLFFLEPVQPPHPPPQEVARSKWGDKFGFLLISSSSQSFLMEQGHHKRALRCGSVTFMSGPGFSSSFCSCGFIRYQQHTEDTT